jgi:hypothetical protein
MHDAIALAAAALRAGWWLAVDHLGNARDDTPRSSNAVTPAWLTEVLQTDFPGTRVRAAERIDGHSGTTDRVRLALSYEKIGNGEEPPASVFCKFAPAAHSNRLFVNLMELGKTEIRCYQEILPGAPIETPRCHHASSRGTAQRFALVMEDLGASNVRFTDSSQPLTADDARLVVRELARLHAAFWESPRFAHDLAWLKSYPDNPNWPIERLVSALALPRGVRKFPELVPDQLRGAAERIIAGRDRLEAVWASGPQTLVHGDSHVGNLYFPAGTVGFLDWQVVRRGQGMRDVSYFLTNSLPTEIRRSHQRDLIGHYLKELQEHGISGPDPAEAWEQYRLHALYTWIAAVFTAAGANFQAEPIARAAVARCCAALVDLDSLAALDALPR